MTREETLKFLFDANNSHHCKDCPYNGNFDSWEGKLPCGQQNCWVDIHNEGGD